MLVIKASVPTFRADVHSISQRWLDMDWNVISEITPKLYLSAVSAITNASLADHNITLIINASKELPIFPTEDVKIFSVRVPVYDATDQDLYPYFLVSVEQIVVSFGQKPKRQYVKRPTTFGQFLKRPKTKKANGKKANKTKRPLEQYKP